MKNGICTCTYTVTFLPDSKKVVVKQGVTILAAAGNTTIGIESVCGAQRKCGKCKVIITENADNLSPLTVEEKELLSEEEIKNGYRLACAASILGDVTLTVPMKSRIGKQRLQIQSVGTERLINLNPLISTYIVEIPKASFDDTRTDKERILSALKEVSGFDLKIEYGVYKRLPQAIREGDWTVSIVVWNNEKIISVEPGRDVDKNPEAYGLAVDVGTTKIAGYLLDLHTGTVMGSEAMMNPQIKYGDDVMSRISYTMVEKDREEENETLKVEELQKCVVAAINQIIEDVCTEANVRTDHVYEVVAVGNTAMQHLLLGICPKYIAWAPYCAALGSEDFKSAEIGIKINENGNVHVFPIIGGFVGGDHVSAILATKMADLEREQIGMLLDIGTNTEIAIGNKEDMISCSCASGPAFEGFHIKYGMRASTGAIERISIDTETFEVRYTTIDGAVPRGLCGSALIDLLAEMLKTGIMDGSGNLNLNATNGSGRVRKNRGEKEFVVVWKREIETGIGTSISSDIVITQRDIRELQLAKAAIRTGAEILMRRRGIKEADIDVIYIAGAFGSYVDPENARLIGMYPQIDLSKVKIVGNAAGSGAKLALLSQEKRHKAEEIAKKVRYIELATEPDFLHFYMSSHYFPFSDISRYL